MVQSYHKQLAQGVRAGENRCAQSWFLCWARRFSVFLGLRLDLAPFWALGPGVGGRVSQDIRVF